MNMYLHELKAYRKSTIIWSLVFMGIIAMLLSFLPSIKDQGDVFIKALKDYPEYLRKALGLDAFDLKNSDSFFNFTNFFSITFIYLTLCGAIQAMNFGTGIVSKETRDKTADFLMTKPVSRIKILSAKLLAVLTSLIITNLFFVAATFLLAPVFTDEKIDHPKILMAMLTIFYLQLIFLSVGTFISVIYSNMKSVLAISLSTVFTFYFIGMFIEIFDETVMRYFRPFKYFDYQYMAMTVEYEWQLIVLTAIIVITLITASFVIYQKKDIQAV
ncbi:MAG: hypothetical protein BGN88_03360 [Clostridiales bacterium 43-6]|nr:MAG: hypothetical protein BGN88_03360 [Clostridiales bacterium 43-6]